MATALGLAACGGGGAEVEIGPTGFYSVPSSAPGEPGILLRSEPLNVDEAPAGARGWRILYTTSAGDGAPAVSSGLVLVPGPGSEPVERVVAWAHGTTGVADQCAPSRSSDGLAVGGLTVADEVLRRGWAIVATDYVGLGTVGLHPYLVGQPGGRSVLDAVRAAQQLDAVAPRGKTVVWGDSEGGGAALWAAKVAPAYAPEVRVDGVAALAPATNLPAILEGLPKVTTSALYLAYLLAAYTSTYPDVTYGAVVEPSAEPKLKRLANYCLDDPKANQAVDASGVLAGPVLVPGPTDQNLRARLAENVPGGRMEAPVLVLQGSADTLVTPASQRAYVKEQCASGTSLDYREYPGTSHGGIVESMPAMRDLLRWTEGRFGGRPIGTTCAG